MSDQLLKAARQVLAALDSEYPREDVPIGHVRTLAEAALASAPQASQPPQGATVLHDGLRIMRCPCGMEFTDGALHDANLELHLLKKAALAASPPPAAWQERQQLNRGEWSDWYGCPARPPGQMREATLGGIKYQWRPLYAAPAPVSPESEFAGMEACVTCGQPVSSHSMSTVSKVVRMNDAASESIPLSLLMRLIDLRILDNDKAFTEALRAERWSQVAGLHGIGTGLRIARRIVADERIADAAQDDPRG